MACTTILPLSVNHILCGAGACHAKRNRWRLEHRIADAHVRSMVASTLDSTQPPAAKSLFAKQSRYRTHLALHAQEGSFHARRVLVPVTRVVDLTLGTLHGNTAFGGCGLVTAALGAGVLAAGFIGIFVGSQLGMAVGILSYPIAPPDARFFAWVMETTKTWTLLLACTTAAPTFLLAVIVAQLAAYAAAIPKGLIATVGAGAGLAVGLCRSPQTALNPMSLPPAATADAAAQHLLHAASKDPKNRAACGRYSLPLRRPYTNAELAAIIVQSPANAQALLDALPALSTDEEHIETANETDAVAVVLGAAVRWACYLQKKDFHGLPAESAPQKNGADTQQKDGATKATVAGAAKAAVTRAEEAAITGAGAASLAEAAGIEAAWIPAAAAASADLAACASASASHREALASPASALRSPASRAASPALASASLSTIPEDDIVEVIAPLSRTASLCIKTSTQKSLATALVSPPDARSLETLRETLSAPLARASQPSSLSRPTVDLVVPQVDICQRRTLLDGTEQEARLVHSIKSNGCEHLNLSSLSLSTHHINDVTEAQRGAIQLDLGAEGAVAVQGLATRFKAHLQFQLDYQSDPIPDDQTLASLAAVPLTPPPQLQQ